MAIFEDVKLSIGGDEYIVPSDKVMGLIKSIENHVVVFDLVNPQHLRNVQLSEAYHAALTYAGAEITLEDVYNSLFQEGKDTVIEKVNGLLSMMIPPKHLRAAESGKKLLSASRLSWSSRLLSRLLGLVGLRRASFGR